jgi:hypothetical protein
MPSQGPTNGLRNFTLALFLSSALSTGFGLSPAQAIQVNYESPYSGLTPSQTTDLFNIYFSSRYDFCDAKLVGALWGADAGEGKLIIADKIRNGIGNNIDLILDESRGNGHRCDWTDAGYSYEDAEALAAYWQMDTPYQAKLRIADLLTQGYGHWVQTDLERLGRSH